MFHTILTLAYTIPNIYVFFRIGSHFINRNQKTYYIIGYLLLALVYPLSNYLEGPSFFNEFLAGLSNYILPFFLYLFIFILFYDILFGLNKVIKIFLPDIFENQKYKKLVLSAIITLSLMVVAAGVINFNTIRTSEYKIDIPGKSSERTHLRIAFAADFHLKEGVSRRFVENFVEKIKLIEPDILLFGGDIVEGDRQSEDLSYYEEILRMIDTPLGVYSVLGNHEYYAGRDKGNFFNKASIKVLNDTIILIDSSFYLAGRYDSHYGSRKSINDLLAPVISPLPLILLDHRPTDILKVSNTITDVQFSGHTHNGQMFPINLIINSMYEIGWGQRKINNTHFFVTSGIRLWGPPVRTTGKSEIIVVDISFTN